MIKLTPWEEFFDIKLFHYIRTQERMFRWIIELTEKNGAILEVGFGSGWSSILLAQLGYHVYGIDENEHNWSKATDMVRLLETMPNFSFPQTAPCLTCQDLFDLLSFAQNAEPIFDTGFSDGVFEHFDDQKVIKAIRIMKDLCKTVIIDVPSWKERNTLHKRGDEIYRKNKEWRKLIKRAGYKTKKTYGDLRSCPKWYWAWLPWELGKHYASSFTKKVGFIIEN